MTKQYGVDLVVRDDVSKDARLAMLKMAKAALRRHLLESGFMYVRRARRIRVRAPLYSPLQWDEQLWRLDVWASDAPRPA